MIYKSRTKVIQRKPEKWVFSENQRVYLLNKQKIIAKSKIKLVLPIMFPDTMYKSTMTCFRET